MNTKISTRRTFRGLLSPVGGGIREVKINCAKGYRVYFKEKGGKIIVLLIGGDKSTQ